MRRLEHRLDDHLRSTQEVAGPLGFLLEQLAVDLHFAVGERTPESFEAEASYELGATDGIGGRGRLARDQILMIAASECATRQSLGRFAIGFGLERRNALCFALIPEAVNKIFFGESVGGTALVTEQVAHGVVVLAVRQPPDRQRFHAALIGQLDAFLRGGELVVGQSSQVVDPTQQDLLFGAAR